MVILTFLENKVVEHRTKSQIVIEGIKFHDIKGSFYYECEEGTFNIVRDGERKKINGTDFQFFNDGYQRFNVDSWPLLVGHNRDIDCDIDFVLEKNKLINDNQYVIVKNHQYYNDKEIPFEDGDIFVVGNMFFSVYGDYINFIGRDNIKVNLQKVCDVIIPEEVYQKSPRIFKRFDNVTVPISNPPSKEIMSKNTVAKIVIPTFISILSTVLMAFLTKRYVFVIIGIITSFCSLTYSLTTFFKEKKEIKKENNKRVEKYESYLLEKRKVLDGLYNNEIDVYNYNYPKTDEIYNLISSYSSRIYERDVYDEDFVRVSIGYINEKPHYSIGFSGEEIKGDDNLVRLSEQVVDKFSVIENVKYTIDLKETHLGIIGDKDLAHEEIKRIILEISAFHSYHDVNFIVIYNYINKKDFSFLDWLPHCKIDGMNLKTNVCDDTIKEQVLASVYQIIKQRYQELKEGKKEVKFFPHFVIFIDDYSLVINHPIMEFFQHGTELGFSMIVRVSQYSDLMSNIKTVMLLNNEYDSELLIENGIEKKLKISRDNSCVDVMSASRNLSVLDHQLGVKNSIPESVTFLEMYGLDSPKELNVEHRWNSSNIHKSISVPLGLRGTNDLVYLNLHEKAHGPHGLVAGTTGSGKSEIIQSYILSLAVNFSPQEVGFLLIDFKGGGMANLFRDLPHVVGTITNLDGSEIMRALSSIKAEMSRRQTKFNSVNVNNINMYNELFKSGGVDEPLPHLFIISDEFAELRQEQPEFMNELISVARIGRTLGVHLILATQKPTGIVNDQIWSNSKFKLALKVQDESDSKEIIKTTDAAYITNPGRAYLQVGNNEIYELFQSAWSGAKYVDKHKEENVVDKRVYIVNKLGQLEVINEDLSSVDDSVNSKETELDVVIREINSVKDKLGLEEIKKVWLPPLSKIMISPIMKDYEIKDLSEINNKNLLIDLGIIDIPEKQIQKKYTIDLIKKPNIAVYGGNAQGKSFTLGTIILDLAIKNNPELLHFYIIDMGNAGLIGFKNLVHVADYVSFNNFENYSKIVNRIEKIVEDRKEKLMACAVQNVYMYEEVTGERLPNIIIVIDNVKELKEMDNTAKPFLEKITSVGPSLGIFIVMSASQAKDIETAITNNINNKVVHQLNISGDSKNILKSTKYELPRDVPGRALVSLGDTYHMHVFSHFNIDSQKEYNESLRNFTSLMEEKFTGVKPKGIPVYPTNFTFSDLDNYEYEIEGKTNNIIGITASNLLQIGVYDIPDIFTIAGPSGSGRTNMIKILIEQSDEGSIIIDSQKNSLVEYKSNEKFKYCNSEEEFKETYDYLMNLIKQREQERDSLIEQGVIKTVKEYEKFVKEKLVFIDEYDDFYERLYGKFNLVDLVSKGRLVNIKFIIAINSTITKDASKDKLFTIIKQITNSIVLGKMTSYVPISLNSSQLPKFGYGILSYYGDLVKVKIPQK